MSSLSPPQSLTDRIDKEHRGDVSGSHIASKESQIEDGRYPYISPPCGIGGYSNMPIHTEIISSVSSRPYYRVSIPGKVILSGEYAVVAGKRGISCAIDKRLEATLKAIDGKKSSICILYNGDKTRWENLDDDSVEYKLLGMMVEMIYKDIGSKGEKKEDHDDNNNNSEKKAFEIKITSDFPLGSGLGFSGALNVALGALLTLAIKGDGATSDISTFLSSVNQLAFLGENIIHGTASGIDNTTSCYGGGIEYEKGMMRKRLSPKSSFKILIVFTGPKLTRKSLNNLKSYTEAHKEEYEDKMDKLDHLTKAIEEILFVESTTSNPDIVLHSPHTPTDNITKEEIDELRPLFQEVEQTLESLNLVSDDVKSVIHSLESLGIVCKMTGGGGEKGGSVVGILDPRDIEMMIEKLEIVLGPQNTNWWISDIDRGLEILREEDE